MLYDARLARTARVTEPRGVQGINMSKPLFKAASTSTCSRRGAEPRRRPPNSCAGVLQVAERHPQPHQHPRIPRTRRGPETQDRFTFEAAVRILRQISVRRRSSSSSSVWRAATTAGVASVAQNRGIQPVRRRAKLRARWTSRRPRHRQRRAQRLRRHQVTFHIDASREDIEALVAQSQKRSAVYDVVTNPTNVTVEVV